MSGAWPRTVGNTVQNWWMKVAMQWVRKHPIWSGLLVLVFGLFYAAAIAGDGTAGGIVAVTVLLVIVIGAMYLIGSIVGWWRGRRRRQEAIQPNSIALRSPDSARSPVPSSGAPVWAESQVAIPQPTALGLGDMLAMSPLEYEQLCTRVLLAIGYTEVRRSGGAGDLNADIVATDSLGRSAVVQCKRYAPGSSVGTPALQTFIGMVHVHHRADRGIFMTTAQYSQPAIEFAREHGIVLIDGAFLVKLLDLANIR